MWSYTIVETGYYIQKPFVSAVYAYGSGVEVFLGPEFVQRTFARRHLTQLCQHRSYDKTHKHTHGNAMQCSPQLQSECTSIKETVFMESQSYGASPAIWDHTVLPATRHRCLVALTPAMQAGTRFTYPGGMGG